MLAQDTLGRVIALSDQPPYFVIDLDGSSFAIVAVLRDLASQEDLLFLLAECQRPQIAHAKLANHLARQFGGAFDIVACAGAHLVEEQFLGDAATHHDGDLRLQILLVVVVLVVDGQLHRHTQSHAAGDDRDLVHRIRMGQLGGNQRMAGFVIGSHFLLFF